MGLSCGRLAGITDEQERERAHAAFLLAFPISYLLNRFDARERGCAMQPLSARPDQSPEPEPPDPVSDDE